jgi:hypothetical protein
MIGEVVAGLVDVRRPDADQLAGTVRYRVGDDVWEQRFVARLLTDDALEAELAQAGLRLSGWADDRRAWALAR